MKFPQLALSQRFRWRGAVYRKAGPLTAHAEADGTLAMVPRSALVEPLGVDEPHAGGQAAGVRHPEAVAEALEALIAQIGGIADGLAEPDAERLRASLDQARRAFVERVGL